MSQTSFSLSHTLRSGVNLSKSILIPSSISPRQASESTERDQRAFCASIAAPGLSFTGSPFRRDLIEVNWLLNSNPLLFKSAFR